MIRHRVRQQERGKSRLAAIFVAPFKFALGAALFTSMGAGAFAAAPSTVALPSHTGSAHRAQTMPAALRPAYYQALASDGGAAYALNKAGCASLPKSGLKACFDADGAHFKAASSLALRLVAWGRAKALTQASPVRPVIKADRVSYRHGSLTEWWRVLPVGFEQGFTIAKRPRGHGELTLVLTTSRQGAGASSARHSRESGNPVEERPSTSLRYAQGERKNRTEGSSDTLKWGKLRYGKLVVTDANGKVVPATLKSKGNRILIAVNDAHAVYPLTVDPLIWIREQKVVASDGVGADEFGTAVAVQGTTAMIGGGQDGPGAVYVFTESSAGVWSETQKLTAADGVGGDDFGTAIALDGTSALIGAFFADIGCGSDGGHLYVFTESGGTWTQTQEFDGCSPLHASALGISIAVNGPMALVGGGWYDNAPGSAFVFTEAGGVWSETQKLVSSVTGPGYDHFGQTVALSDTTALIGSPARDLGGYGGQGAVDVYTVANGILAHTATLTASDEGAEAGTHFGSAVALAGDEALIGAPFRSHDNDENEEGAVYVFTDASGAWSQTQELFPDPLDMAANFGSAIVAQGSVALVGAWHDAATYVLSESNGTWMQTARLVGDPTPQSYFGWSVAFDGVYALIGAKEDTINGNFDTGSAYFFGYANLGLAVSAPKAVAPGANYVSQTIATNEASATSPAVTATMAVPVGASFVSATATQGSCTQKKGVVTCKFGLISGNAGTAKANVTLKATGDVGDTIGNTASIAKATPALTASAKTEIATPNHPPVAKDGTLTADENTAASGTLKASDADGDALTFSIVAKPKHGTVKLDDASKGTYTYTPDQDYSGADSFTFKANDGKSDSNVATVSITVKQHQNSPPVANNGSLTTNENTAASGTLKASDADGDALTFSIVAKPKHGTVKLTSASSGDYTYTPDKNYTGADSFTFKANDGKADSNTAKVSVTVKNTGGSSSGGGGGTGPFGLGLLALIGVLGAWMKRVNRR